ncbi:MAG: polysaccharide biosynthesis/export family protein [Kiritimatiellia bacterium]|jgi:protein involved in polysaccharide export with SLBB domain
MDTTRPTRSGAPLAFPFLFLASLAFAVAGAGCALLPHGDDGADSGFDSMLGGLLPPLPGGGSPSGAGVAAVPGENGAPPAGEDLPAGVVPVLGEDGEPQLRVGLVLSISVLVNDKVEVPEQNYLISLDNTVALPFVGAVSCEGLTLSQFRRRLTELYSDYLHDPNVRADFVTTESGESPWGKVRVMGHVGHEGWINIPPTRDLSLLRALQLAGGVARGAKRSDVRITRILPDGTKQTFRADLDKLGRQGDVEQDIPLEPGDTIWVDERIW